MELCKCCGNVIMNKYVPNDFVVCVGMKALGRDLDTGKYVSRLRKGLTIFPNTKMHTHIHIRMHKFYGNIIGTTFSPEHAPSESCTSVQGRHFHPRSLGCFPFVLKPYSSLQWDCIKRAKIDSEVNLHSTCTCFTRGWGSMDGASGPMSLLGYKRPQM